MNWMTTAKKRVGKTSKKAKREEASRLGAWMKIQQPSSRMHAFGKSEKNSSSQNIESSDLHMLRKLPQPAKTNIQQSSDDMSISNYKNKKMKNDSNVLISSLDLSPIKTVGNFNHKPEIVLDQGFIQEFAQCQIIDFYNNGKRCDESGRALNSPKGVSVEDKSPRDNQDGSKKAPVAHSAEISIPSSSIALESDRNRWWNRTVQKLTACVEVPVVDYIKLDLQLKDVSLNGCADIFNLENSDAAAVGKPKFDTRTVLRSLYKAINHLRMDTDSLSTILDLIRYLEIVDKQSSKPAAFNPTIKATTPTPRTVESSSSRRLPLDPIKSKSKIAAAPPSERDEPSNTATMEDWDLFGLKSISCLSAGDPNRPDSRNPFFDCEAISEIEVGVGPSHPDQSSYDHFSPGHSPREKKLKAAHSTPVQQDNHCDFLTDLSFIQFD